ncbi:MAG: hypothetical protein OEM77_05560 [Nitrosopumilus sp.]|nr:hypothetical protein [Nitrosopumilus sp.]MDH3735402.1 hypothetical protein [Nitrosopumilus sp.]MDH3822236.1 hypothetical protein [Nitrosopumilus sp.]MDH3832564.1 hypothetical protein [Nitrosopumilus sp.]
MRQVLVTLSHGLQSSESKLYHVKLRELNGFDEQFLESIKNELPAFLQTTELLKKTTLFESEMTKIQKDELFKTLTIGDRICLLLNLRKITFGNSLSCIMTCDSCKEKASFELDIDSLLNLGTKQIKTENYLIHTKNFSLKIRPLTVLDQESILSYSDKRNFKEKPTDQLIRSCIVSSKPNLSDSSLPQEIIDAVNPKLNEIDPMADIILDLKCPACDHSLQTPFEIENFVLREIYSQISSLEKEIHWLAFNYNWSEKNILNLPIQKRHRYIELINETLSGE